MAKKVTKKKVAKKVTKAVAKLEESILVESSLSHSLANMGDVDTTVLGEVELDVVDDMDLFKNDIVIPKIHLIQSMSELRKQKKADEGDYVDSRSDKILLAADSEQEFLPLIVIKTFKRWQTFQKTENGQTLEKKKFLSSEIITSENIDLPYQDTLESEEISRRQVISAYVLLGDDAQKGIIKPYIIDFAGGAGKSAGRALVSDIKILNTAKKDPRTGALVRKGLPSWVAWFKLSQFETTMNDNDFNAKNMEFGGQLPQEMWGFLKDANDEVKALMQNDAVEIDDSDLYDSAKNATSEQTSADVTSAATQTDAGI